MAHLQRRRSQRHPPQSEVSLPPLLLLLLLLHPVARSAEDRDASREAPSSTTLPRRDASAEGRRSRATAQWRAWTASTSMRQRWRRPRLPRSMAPQRRARSDRGDAPTSAALAGASRPQGAASAARGALVESAGCGEAALRLLQKRAYPTPLSPHILNFISGLIYRQNSEINSVEMNAYTKGFGSLLACLLLAFATSIAEAARVARRCPLPRPRPP